MSYLLYGVWAAHRYGKYRCEMGFNLALALQTCHTVPELFLNRHDGASIAADSGHVITEALKGHRVVWKIDICYLIRMT